MTRYRSVALWFTAAAAVIALGVQAGPASSRLVYNPTTSAPTGWYWVVRSADLKVADYVLTRLPREVARLASERQYLPQSVPLLKRIGAVRAQTVCLSGDTVFVDGRAVAITLARDRLGRNLVAWRHCRTMESDELFLLSESNPASFDSRYFGPIELRYVIGKVIPLWTW